MDKSDSTCPGPAGVTDRLWEMNDVVELLEAFETAQKRAALNRIGDLAMANPPQQLTVTDPDNVSEILCDGQFNVSVIGKHVVLTFTHVRPDATTLFRDGRFEPTAIVRARIVISLENLAAFRDLLNRVIQAPDTPAPPAGGPTRH
jgi:hypothetical protein